MDGRCGFNTANPDALRPGDSITLSINDLTREGAGVGRRQGMAVFVPGALPGEEVRVVIRQVRKRFLIADLAAILQACPERVKPACPSGNCGGCQLLHMSYPAQLKQKQKWVADSLKRLGGLAGPPVEPTLGMKDPWHYRNKVRLHVHPQDGRTVLGLYAAGSHTLESVLNGEGDCLLLREPLNRLARAVEHLLGAFNAAGHSPADGKRLLHHVTLREAVGTGETMVIFETVPAPWPQAQTLARELVDRHGVTAVLRQVDPSPNRPSAHGTTTEILAGQPYITDNLEGLKLRLSPSAFSQINPAQTAVLYRKVSEYAALTGRETVIDAYSGVGSIALFLARSVKRVVGLESVKAAVTDATRNAALNNIDNASFRAGRVETLLPQILRDGPLPDLVILDPPRRGCHPNVLQAMTEHLIPRLIYVSCDPGTLARDLGILAGHGYRLRVVQPVDMFPHTVHVECVVLLGIKSSQFKSRQRQKVDLRNSDMMRQLCNHMNSD